MDLFDVIKTIFKKGKAWDEVGKNDKVKNFFMINRIMSVQFPVQANQFNHTKVSPRPVIDWWHDTMSNYYSKTPPWIFTKTKKKEGKDEKKVDFSDYEEAEKFIMKRYATTPAAACMATAVNPLPGIFSVHKTRITRSPKVSAAFFLAAMLCS
jgi:hypothetical protein